MPLTSLFAEESASGPFTVLTVCTGNICRSPLAEMLLRKVLVDQEIRVHSAGTEALVGRAMPEQNQIIASELGVTDEQQHRARQLDVGLIRESDLVLALTREHRRAVVEMLPRATRRVFTLREFGRLAEAIDVNDLQSEESQLTADRLRAVVDLVAQLRGTLPPLANPDEDDVVDPYRQSDEVYARSAQEIIPAVNQIAKLFRLATSEGERA